MNAESSLDADTKRLCSLTATDNRSDDAVQEIVSLIQRKAPKLLDGLTESNKQQLARSCRAKLYAFDETVFDQGDEPDAYYTVIRGAVSIYALRPSTGDTTTQSSGRSNYGVYITQLPPGESFGELSFNADGNHSRRNAGVVSDGCHGEARVGNVAQPSDVCVLLLIPEQCYMSEMFARHSAKHQTKDKINLLKSSSLFRHWTMDQLVKFAYAMKKKTFDRGSTVIEQGERMEHLWIIQSGGVRISHRVVPPSSGMDALRGGRKQLREPITVEIAHLGPRDMIGLVESADEGAKKSQREAVALTAVETFFLPLSFVKPFLAEDAATRSLVDRVAQRRRKWELLRREYAAKFPQMSMQLPKDAASMSRYAMDGCDPPPRLSRIARQSGGSRKTDAESTATGSPIEGRHSGKVDGLLRPNRAATLDGLFGELSRGA
ncbi:hypothetical protein ACHAXT_004909 [Thalassiosira profunda]